MRATETTCVLMILYCLTHLSMHVACSVYCCILYAHIGQIRKKKIHYGPGVAGWLLILVVCTLMQTLSCMYSGVDRYTISLSSSCTTTHKLHSKSWCSVRNSNSCKVLNTWRGNFLHKGLTVHKVLLAIQLLPRQYAVFLNVHFKPSCKIPKDGAILV